MTVQVITEERTKTLKQLTDIEPEFVSLVRHGANRQGFRVVKSDEPKGDIMTDIVQSLLVPVGTTIETLAGTPELGWLADASQSRRVEKGDYVELPQISEDKFVPNSLSLRRLGGSGALAVVGELEAEKAQGDELVMPNPMTAAIATQTTPNREYSFEDLFFKELDGFIDVVRGTMSQAKMDSGARKKAVMNAHKAFGSWLAMGLDALNKAKSDESLSALASGLEKTRETLAELLPKQEKIKEDQGGIFDMFKTKEELAAFVGDVIDQRRVKEEEDQKAQTMQAEEFGKAVDEAVQKKIEELGLKPVEKSDDDPKPEDKLVELEKEIASLKEKQDVLKRNLSGNSSASTDEGATKEKADKDDKEKAEYLLDGVPVDKRGNLYEGVLFNWPGIRRDMKKAELQ